LFYPTVRVLSLFDLFSGLATLNVIGVKQGIGLVKITTVAKLIPIILLITIGWKDVQWVNLSWESCIGSGRRIRTGFIR
jgi:basic amino acid/polyamine antiporter, APA family